MAIVVYRNGPIFLQLLLGRRYRLHGVLPDAKVDGIPLGSSNFLDAKLVFWDAGSRLQFRSCILRQVRLGRDVGLLFRVDLGCGTVD